MFQSRRLVTHFASVYGWWEILLGVSIEDIPTQSCLKIFLRIFRIVFVLLNSISQYLFKKYESIKEVHISIILIPLFLLKNYWKYNSFEMILISFGGVSFNYNVRRFPFFFTYLDSASNSTLLLKWLFSATLKRLPLFLFNCLFGRIIIYNFNKKFISIKCSELWLEVFFSL